MSQQQVDGLKLRMALRALRLKHTRSARDFAKEVGLSHSTVAKIENVKNKKLRTYDPGIVVLSKYVAPFAVSLAALIEQHDLHIPPQTKTDSTNRRQSATTIKDVQSGEDSSLPVHDDIAHYLQLSRACLAAAEHTDRRVIKQLLGELAYAFGMAAHSTPEDKLRLIRKINEQLG